MNSLNPLQAQALINNGALLIDISETDEFRHSSVPGAHNAPLSCLQPADIPPGTEPVIYMCRAGFRTQNNAARLESVSGRSSYLLEGGIKSWRAAGLPVNATPGAPVDIMRQVQMLAGGLALLGFLLGVFVNPAFHLLSGVIGAGLLFAGLSGFCGMARVLALAPWNKSHG